MKTEKGLLILILLGAILKAAHVPGGSALLALSCVVLGFLYFPLGFYFLSGKTFKDQDLAYSIATGIVLSIDVFGSTFKLLKWPGASFMLLAGLPFSIFMTYTTYSKKKSEEELGGYFTGLFNRLIVSCILTFILFLLPRHWLN